MIRFATMEDLPRIVEMACEFAGQSPYKEDFKSEKIHDIAKMLIEGGGWQRVIFVSENMDGFLAATTQPFLFGDKVLAVEIAWWVSPEARKNGVGDELRVAYEHWAKAHGCSKCTMCCLDEDVLKYYLKNDYKLFEYACIKDI